MERNIVKQLAIALLLSSSLGFAVNEDLLNDPVFKKLSGQFEKLHWETEIKSGVSFDIFLEAISNNIKKAIFDVMLTVDDFISPKNPNETFSQYVEKCRVLAEAINNHVVQPVKIGKSSTTGLNYQIIALTDKIVSDMYSKIYKLYQILDAHNKSAQKTNAVVLAKPLKDLLPTLASVSTIQLVDNDLGSLYSLLISKPDDIDPNTGKMIGSEVFKNVAVDIKDLRELLSRVKAQISKTQQALQLELLAKIRARLKRL